MSQIRPGPQPSGAIHDIGYRPYSGARQGEAQVALALFIFGLRNLYGFGRSMKSKLMPLSLLFFNLIPAAISVAVIAYVRLPSLPISYATYPTTTLVLTSVFAAAQAPVLFSHDQRYGSIALYLARPLSSLTYALVRWASLAVGLLIFIGSPLLLLAVGSMLAEYDASEAVGDFIKALVLVVVLAAMIASVAGLASSLSIRRGFAIMATIGALLFGYGVLAAVQGIAEETGSDTVGVVAGWFNPFTIYAGLVSGTLDEAIALTPPESTLAVVSYVLAAAVMIVAGIAMLGWRYRKVAGR